jgi:ParB/RepB/Spo0J family partition protein
MTMGFRKASNRRLTLATVPRESSAADRLLDNSRQMIRLDLIDDNPRNPRSQVDENTLGELAASIAEHGLLQAPVVRRHPDNPDRYMVVLGARRVAAHRLLGREEVEVIVRRLDDHQAFLASCVENVQRVELSPREEMDMIGVLVDELGSQEAAARALGKSPTWLSKRKRVLSAPALAAAVERGEISLDHAYDVITRSPDEETALTQLEQVRIGGQSQGMTRGKLSPRPHRSERTASLSDRNIPTRPSAETFLQTDTLSGRNDDHHEMIGSESEPVLISARNSSSQEQTDDNRSTTEDDTIVLKALATVQLTLDGRGRVSRQAVLYALRSDLAMIEGR